MTALDSSGPDRVVTRMPATDTERFALSANRHPKHRLRVAGHTERGYDIVDYIYESTHQIWDEKFIGKIYDYYHPGAIVHTSNGTIYGRDQVIRLTTIRQAAFPDTRDFIEEVIWTGNQTDGFETSMRWTLVGTNTGHSLYGPPTGRKVAVRGIANCIVKDNRVVEEWVAYNEISLIRQLGLDPMVVMESMAQAGVSNAYNETGPRAEPFGEIENAIAQSTPAPVPAPTHDGFDVEYFVRRAYHEIWNWKYLGKVDEYFHPTHLSHASSDRKLYGIGDYKYDILCRMQAFPDLVMQIDKIFWNRPVDADELRVGVRWTMQGTHTGPGIYGKPTGRRVKLLGISQHYIRGERFAEEYTEFGEFALMKQLRFGMTP